MEREVLLSAYQAGTGTQEHAGLIAYEDAKTATPTAQRGQLAQYFHPLSKYLGAAGEHMLRGKECVATKLPLKGTETGCNATASLLAASQWKTIGPKGGAASAEQPSWGDVALGCH